MLHLLQYIGVDFVRWIVAKVRTFIATVPDGAFNGACHCHLPAVPIHLNYKCEFCHLAVRAKRQYSASEAILFAEKVGSRRSIELLPFGFV